MKSDYESPIPVADSDLVIGAGDWISVEDLHYEEPEATTSAPTVKTNYDKLHNMSKEELARFIDKNTEYDGTPWSKWFDKNYCKNCEPIRCDSDTARKELGLYCFYGSVTCAYCELHHHCKFFSDLDYIPDSYDTILMWMEEQVDD